ncbi:lytic transglycosylase domain-containing protein [Saccharospirillum mangrovi]|uniref:lytic transglycosylase domain-containing protein n=1 Tax=Saccharospirillum mangrovi TaxID=2161747 RepID=UPI000D366BFC|nr:lytic transglycosylase domain-containing protein [Saccharospirillum mangrovi]
MNATRMRMLIVFCLAGTLPVLTVDASLPDSEFLPDSNALTESEFLEQSHTAAADYALLLQRIQNDDISFAELNDWQDHPLFPHLITHWAMRHPQDIDLDWFIVRLLQPEWKAAGWEFRQAWMEELARRERWADYIGFDLAWSGAGHPCRRFQAQQALGQPVPDEQLRQLWLTGDSLPAHCDPFLDRLRQDDDYNELVWQRQLLAFHARNSRMVRYLNDRYDDPQWRQRGQRLRAVYLSPAGLFNQPYDPDVEWQRDLALAAIDRLAYRDPHIASNLWVELIKQTPRFTQQEVQQTSHYLGVAMAKLALPQADYWLGIADPNRDDSEVQHWRLQIALADNNWLQVATLFRSLDPTLREDGQWRYWAALADQHLGLAGNAEQQLAVLAKERSYYGFLAAAALGTPADLNLDEAPVIHSLQPMIQRPALQRALTLYAAGDIVRAQIEWNLTLDGFDARQLMEAAQLAQRWQWYHKASQTAGMSGRYGELSLRYPTPFADVVGQLTESPSVPRHWLYGVMRQESHFMTQARSPVGARGLMQLMPYTARGLAIKSGLNYQNPEDLDDPTLNITLGRNYLDQMQRRFGGPVYATAAYNAGPSRVASWVTRYPADLRVWVESIPFDETRNYVKSVLTFAQIYAMRDGEDWTLASWLNAPDLATLTDAP